jgi:O-antigen/teichoic acid export membrane protein
LPSVVSNTLLASLGRVGSGALGVWLTALLTPLLGAGQFGIYTLLISYASLLQAFADAGLYLNLTRLLSASPHEEARRYFTHTLLLRLFLFLIAFTAGLFFLPFLPALRGYSSFFYLIALGFLAQSLSQLTMGLFQARGTMRPATVGDILGRLAQIIAFISLARWLTNPLLAAALAYALGAGVALFYHLLFSSLPRSGSTSVEPALLRQLLLDSWPLGLLLLLNMLYFRIDQIMLSYFRLPEEVGWYGLSYRLVESLLFFPAAFGGLLLPRLTAALAFGRVSEASLWLKQALQLTLLAAGLLVLLLPLSAGSLILLLANASFLPSIPLLKILSLALAMMFVGNLFGFTLVALQQSRSLLRLYGFLVVFNVLANLVFIPLAGAYAAAWTTVATELLATLLAGRLVFKTLPSSLSSSFLVLWLLVVLVALASLLIIPASWPLLIRLGLISGLYLFFSWQFKLFNSQQLSLLLK